MRLWLAIFFSWFPIIPLAWAASVEIAVPPDGQTQQAYSFNISTNTAAVGLAFHIIITNKVGEIPTNSEAYVGTVTHTTNGERGTTIVPTDPVIPITLIRGTRFWVVDFTLPAKAITQPGLNFIFVDFAHSTINGNTVFMPSADFYELKLGDFAAH